METARSKWVLIPLNTKKTLFRGVLHVCECDFIFELWKASNMSLSGSSFTCDWELRALLKGYEDFLKERLKQSHNEEEFLNEIHSLAVQLHNTRQRRLKGFLNSPNITHQSNIIKELELIGWERLAYIDQTFSSLTLSARDSASREHLLHLKFNAEDPTKRPSLQADLPILFKPKWSHQDGILQQIYDQFLEELSKYQELWEMLDEFDGKCWILEPETKSWSCSYRRVAIASLCQGDSVQFWFGNRSSLLVNLNPLQPRALPECRFLGADEYMTPLLDKWNHRLSTWDICKTVLSNLEEILEIDFPSPASASKEELTMDCCICYAYKLNNEIPEVTCADSRCGQLFHSECLVEWIRSLPNFRQSFNVLFGECPYCSTPLTVKMCKKTKLMAKK